MNDQHQDFGRRKWSLAFGVLYIAAGLLAGLNVDLVWDILALEGANAGTRRVLSTLTIILPHVVAITGFTLLIAGSRLSGRSFIAVALLPATYAILCLIVRAVY